MSVCLRGFLGLSLYKLSASIVFAPSITSQKDYCSVSTTMSSVKPDPASAVFVTCPTMEVARTLSRGLVQSKLAACVNIVPQVTSIYEWEGSIEEDTEYLMIIKTQSSTVPDLTTFVQSNHPYDVPEVISFKIEQGSEKYLSWVKQSTQRAKTN